MKTISKSEERAEMVAVSDDASRERGLWLTEGAWVAVVTGSPIYHGKISAITPTHIFLDEASWIPDTGRCSNFVANPSNCSESEYIGEVAIERPVVAVYRLKTSKKIETK